MAWIQCEGITWDALNILTTQRDMRKSPKHLSWPGEGNEELVGMQEVCRKLRLCPSEENRRDQYLAD